jgi:hypothetical protein
VHDDGLSLLGSINSLIYHPAEGTQKSRENVQTFYGQYFEDDGIAVIREDNVARLKTKLIVSGANIPLTFAAERPLHDRHVLVVPDFIANAGGVICAAVEYQGGTQSTALQMIEEKIRCNTTLVLEEATKQGILPRQAAMAMAERRVRGAMTYRRWSSAGAGHIR